MEDYQKRPLTLAEEKYAFPQSDEISNKAGLIGYLRADFGTSGKDFNTSWETWNKERNNPLFSLIMNEVIDGLQKEGEILSSRAAMRKYCRQTPQSQMAKEHYYYGVRVNADFYAFMMRMTPNKGDYNLYCYCYERKWLDHHLKRAEKGIRFIDPSYKELFRIPDGDRIQITTSTDEVVDRTCRYIDDYHVEVNQRIYHISEFAELMERNGNTVIPLRSSLPERCYAYLPTTQEITIVKKGESGYYRSDLSPVYGQDGKAFVEELNRQGGVSKAQAEAMIAGAMFGWACPAADPANYDENGTLLKAKHRDRGEER